MVLRDGTKEEYERIYALHNRLLEADNIGYVRAANVVAEYNSESEIIGAGVEGLAGIDGISKRMAKAMLEIVNVEHECEKP